MKSITTMLIIISLALMQSSRPGEISNPELDQLWKEVDARVSEGQPRAALKVVEKILANIEGKEFPVHYIKAVQYKANFIVELEEEGYFKAIDYVESEVNKNVQGEVLPLLRITRAELMKSYLKANVHRLGNRTSVPSTTDADIRSWSVQDFESETDRAYQRALQSAEGLQEIPTIKYEAIIDTGSHSLHLMPTMYEYLFYSTIQHYANSYQFSPEPFSSNTIDWEKYLVSYKDFLKMTKDDFNEVSRKSMALRYYSELIQFQVRRIDKNPFLFTDLQRIELVRSLALKTNRINNKYENLLLAHANNFSKTEEVALVHYDLARYYLDRAGKEVDKSEAGAFRIRAHRSLSEGMATSKNSYGAEKCRELLVRLERPVLRMQMKEAVSVNQPFLVRLDYKEIDNVRLKVIKVDHNKYRRFISDYRYRDEIPNLIATSTPISEQTVALENNKNYTEYSREVMVQGLAPSPYLIYIESEDKKTTAWAFVYSTNLSFAFSPEPHATDKLVVVDRKTGLPQADVEIRLLDFRNRDESSKSRPVLTGNTNNQGIYSITGLTSRSYQVELIKGNDHFIVDDRYFSNRYPKLNARKEATILTDRAIYRPGQTIHFKAIVYRKDEEDMPTLLVNEEVEIGLRNPNGKFDAKIKGRTNRFGSFSGTFTAPEFGLKGQFFINCLSFGTTGIRIEEYKRPKFKVDLSIPDGHLLAGEQVLVPGHAKTFAGTDVSDAKVSYKVVRTFDFGPYGWWYRGPMPSNEETLIAQGETTTNENGEFEIPFTPLQTDASQNRWKPVHVYRIVSDVTDLNGETRSGTVTLRMGDPYYITTDIANRVNTFDFTSFKIRSNNAMGKPATANVELELQTLSPPSSAKVERLWEPTDYPVGDKSKFESSFPHLNYDKVSDYSSWEPDGFVLLQSFELTGEKEIQIGQSLDPGAYKVIVRDFDGKEKYVHYFSVYSFEEKQLVSHLPLGYVLDRDSYQPGQDVKLLLSSGFDASKVFVQIEKDQKVVSEEWMPLTEANVLEIPVSESDRGGFAIRLLHVVHNSFRAEYIQVDVPWTNKKLDITWETFRDKLLPGEPETWNLKISGPDKEGVIAEVAAGMYDLSLDEFVPHQWQMNLFPKYGYYSALRLGGIGMAQGQSRSDAFHTQNSFRRVFPGWRYLNTYGHYGRLRRRMSGGPGYMKDVPMVAMSLDEESMSEEQEVSAPNTAEPPTPPPLGESESANLTFAPRENLNETVFFKPRLKSDEDGNLIIKFKMNEALTTWKVQLLAHTKSLQSATATNEVVTQKNIMVFPQIPRFIREGDSVVINAKINRLVDEKLNGQASIELINAINGDDVTEQMIDNSNRSFSLEDRKSTSVQWKVAVPQGFLYPLEIIVRAQSGKHTDGESIVIPVLTNRMLLTEAKPLSVRAGETKSYRIKELAELTKNGIQPHRLTLEYMENPVWFAVQSLPYLTDYPHQCTEQIVHKIYANAIAGHIIDQYPKIQSIFKEWESKEELISNLNKNSELKSALVEETPWLRDAESEEQQMKNIALLFDYQRMAADLASNMNILASRQKPSGGFVWFADGQENIYITQLVVEVFGHLRTLGIDLPQENRWKAMVNQAIRFSHKKMQERFDRLDKSKIDDDILDPSSLHSIYVTSFFMDGKPDLSFKAWKYYFSTAKKVWLQRSLYEQALLASAFHRMDEVEMTKVIVASFKDRALRSEELGMYWKHQNGYRWYARPIETQAHIMEAIALVDTHSTDMNEMRIWLLKHKQTNRWNTTVATAKAVYALLLRGDDWMGSTNEIYIEIGDEIVSNPETPRDSSKQSGTGYMKRTWNEEEISAEMGQLTVRNDNEVISWGAVYWQYFQDIDEVQSHTDNPLKIKRSIHKKIRTDNGEKLVPITGESLQVGDKVTIRLELTVDRMMEFIHLKDLRAAGLEPIEVLSSYRWSGGLGYYQSTTDLGTHFFIDHIRAGTYVLEYDTFAFNAGDYTGGLATIQCMYAPEFTSHSAGVRMQIQP